VADVPNDAFVVRGGESKARDMEVSAEKHHEAHGEYALSGWSVPNASPEEIAHHAREAGDHYLPHGKIRAARAGDLRAAGYEVEGTGYVSIKLPSPPTEADWQKLNEIFDDPIPNPVAL
jgi:hypothetical protein